MKKSCFQLESPFGLDFRPSWPPFGSLLTPKMAETCLGISLGTAKSPSRVRVSASEASKSVPRGPQRAKKGSKKGARYPRGFQEGSGTDVGPIFDQYWKYLGIILQPCWSYSSHMFRSFVEPLLEQNLSALSLHTPLPPPVSLLSLFTGRVAPCQ